MIEATFAALGLAVCIALLLRMLLPLPQQRRWDAFWRRRRDQLYGSWAWLRRQGQLLRASPSARREAERAIERARRSRPPVERDGNVIRPRHFRRDDDGKPPTLH